VTSRSGSARWRERGASAVVALPLAVGGAGTIVAAPTIGTWYRTRTNPPWNPPDAVFGPVWSLFATGLNAEIVRRNT